MHRTSPSQRSAHVFSLILPALLVTLSGCTGTKSVPSSPQDSEQPTGALVDASECKSFRLAPIDSVTPSNMDCIEYAYGTDSSLVLRHVNAAFNCCPGALFATFEFHDSVIIIEEHETAALCGCDCLYDLEFALRHISPGVYGIKVIEPYVGDDEEPLDFVVDLRIPASGNYCVERDTYPWNAP